MNIDQFKQLPLWKQLATTSTPVEIAMVETHLQYILPLMEQYIDTFPTYTLHNREHIYNVMRIMGDLLGDQLGKLSGLEVAILILSAAYHDFGMVFSADERKAIKGYENFKREFLVQHPRARILFEENNREVSKDLAEWYCRWAHAVRVWPKMAEMEAGLGALLWNGVPFREQLGFVCESHNEPAEHIRVDDGRFDSKFLNMCDLRFCGLMLRLADILDFDNSRSPASVYEFLDLGNPKNHAEEISRDEWNKHMASRGFQFAKSPDGRPLFFTAAPPHPYIEQGIRSFLDLIDMELRAAEKVAKYCSDKWRDFPFPEAVERSGIVSNNYVSGKYQFSLSEDKILDLLTGDGLYTDDFVFIRELLQNAIDTVRHRTFIEQIRDLKFEPAPVRVSFFKDAEGYYWLRLDDEGMGMNAEIIRSYLLKKGNSYYNSDLFKLDKIAIHDKSKADFVPISRFGIGLLSCFMTCDKVEISTCHYHALSNGKLPKTRLSIEGRGGFWVIRSEEKHHVADRMPSEAGWEKGYRSTIGTSIACRIKTTREFHGLNMHNELERFLFAPEIPVVFESKLLGGDRAAMINKPWCKHLITPLPDDFVGSCSALLGLEFPEGISIEVRPVDLTSKAAHPNLSGQLVMVIPRIKVASVSNYFNTGQYFRISFEGKNSFLVCYQTKKDEHGREIKTELKHDITELIDAIEFPEKFSEQKGAHSSFIWPRVSHNGIVIYDNKHQLQLLLKKFDQYDEAFRHQNFTLSTGIFSFKDALLPEVMVSRNAIKRFTPMIVAHVLYATRELNEYTKSEQELFSYFPDLERDPDQSLWFTVEELEKSGVYEVDKDYWHSLPCMLTKENGLTTMTEAIEMAGKGPVIFRVRHFESRFYHEMAQYMIVKNFIVTYVPDGDDYYLEAKLPADKIVVDPKLCPYLPMKFLDAADPSKVTLKNFSLNKQHPLIKWFLQWSHLIEKDFFYLGIQLCNELINDAAPAHKIGSVTEILERLRVLLPPNARPAKELDIKNADLYIKGKE
jgi:hypothetical protein